MKQETAMRPPGALKPQDFKNLTDEELHDVKVESMVDSNYWELATAEEQRRERLQKRVSPWPHPVTIVIGLVSIIIAAIGLWINAHKVLPSVPHQESSPVSTTTTPATPTSKPEEPTSTGPATANGKGSVANTGTIGTINQNSQPKPDEKK
jgi:hypothetical protein